MSNFFTTKGKNKNAFTIAFYNLENLFDTVDDPTTHDDNFTEEGKLKWRLKRYKKKIKKISSVIEQIGVERSYFPPVLVGVAEVENKDVINDLVYSKKLQNHHYDYVHYDSPDKRGIDVGLIYNKQVFELLNSEVFPLYVDDIDGERDFTRDVLLVQGNLNGEFISVIVNHWPSRRKGTEESEYKRLEASKLNRKIIKSLREVDEDAKIIIMGDFNDNPTNKSIRNLIKDDFYNPMQRLLDKGEGSLKHDDDWYLFDQIMYSKNFLKEQKGSHCFKSADVFDKEFLKVYRGKNKGKPFRTYIGKWYQGGYSDHFPVYSFLEKM